MLLKGYFKNRKTPWKAYVKPSSSQVEMNRNRNFGAGGPPHEHEPSVDFSKNK